MLLTAVRNFLVTFFLNIFSLYFQMFYLIIRIEYHFWIKANFPAVGQNMNGNILPTIAASTSSFLTSALLAAT